MTAAVKHAIAERHRTLHLFTLCAFAFTQPVLTALEKQSVYLQDQKFGWIEMSSLLFLLSLLIPMACVAIDRLLMATSRHLRGWGRNGMIMILLLLIMLSVIRPYTSGLQETLEGASGLIVLAILVPCSWYLSSLYEKKPLLRTWLSATSIGIVFFPVMFCLQFHRFQLVAASVDGRIEVKNPVPVILIVFDEFSGITLMNERMEIDEQRFPQFARLAAISTWYRNSTTVSPRTDVAVPAILSGLYPVKEQQPLATNYPGNLLQLIEASNAYEMAIFEPVTRLSPSSLLKEPLSDRPAAEKSIDLIHTLSAVYPRLIFSIDTPVWFPAIPKAWFGLRNFSLTLRQSVSNSGLFHYGGTFQRPQQQEHFLNCLTPSYKPKFCFFHTVLPHYPWTFLANGEQYQSEFTTLQFPSASRGELGEDWDDDAASVLRNEFRYRLQVGFVDRFIGQLLDRLEEAKLLDRCLLIVTADHGVAFQPGHSRRLPDSKTVSEIFSVPLFIKYPNQNTRKVDDRNVETIDLFPTIADVIQMKLPDPVDGIPISMDGRRPRKTLYFENQTTIIEPDFPQRTAAVQRQFSTFENYPLDQLTDAMSSHPDWHGRHISSFDVDERTIPAEFMDPRNLAGEIDYNYRPVLVPRFIAASIESGDLPSIPAEVVLTVDGIVRDTGKTYWKQGGDHGFQFLMPSTIVEDPTGKVEVYLVDSTKPEMRLCRLDIANLPNSK